MSLSSALWSGTGVLHCLVGLAIPDLRTPLLRVVMEGTTESSNMVDRYAREAAIWFQMTGVLMVLQGWTWKRYVEETNRDELPGLWGWSQILMGAGGVYVMPSSGFWLVLAQGLRIVWKTKRDGKDMKMIGNKKK